MTDAQKTRLEELRKLTDPTADQKLMLDDLVTIEKQAKQITDKETFIGQKATELGDLKKQLADAKPADKAALEAQIADKEAVITSLKEALQMAKDAAERVKKTISIPTPGHGGDVDQKAVDALEDKLVAIKAGKEALEKACNAMTDEEFALFNSDLSYRKKVMQMALPAGSEETTRSPWRKKDENKGTPPPDADARLKELFGVNQRQHRMLVGGGGGGPIRRDISGREEPTRLVDTRTS